MKKRKMEEKEKGTESCSFYDSAKSFVTIQVETRIYCVFRKKK